MCEIFPSFENCCGVINLKVGICMIAVLSVITGGILMSATVQTSKVSVNEMMDVTKIRTPKQALNNVTELINFGLIVMSVLFMFLGVILLLATLQTGQEGVIQIFVWGMFLNVCFGFLLIVVIMYDCSRKDLCILSTMDWLTGACLVTFATFYLFLWVYFISVANSLVVLVFSP